MDYSRLDLPAIRHIGRPTIDRPSGSVVVRFVESVAIRYGTIRSARYASVYTYLYQFRHSPIGMGMPVHVPSVQDDAVRDGDAFLVQAIQRQAIRSESFFRNLTTQCRYHLFSKDLPLLLQWSWSRE